MGMFNEYPYRNLTDLNLDYIFKIMKEVEKQVEYFVSLNAIKYADPIQWDITRQYEKNTIVIDPLTGTAYISVAPVPAGTALTRPEYWTVVFDLQRFVTKSCKNFTTRYETETTTTATFNTPANSWLCWADVLYKANVNITAGDSYVPGGNITAFTMEDFGGHLENLLTTDKTNVVAAINELFNITQGIISDMGDLNDLTTVDKTSIVNAINELVTDLSNAINTIYIAIGDLSDLTTTDQSSIVNAINEVDRNVDTLDTKVGDLTNLTTSDKSSIVNAINDINSIIDPVGFVTPLKYGAIGDGTTDDTQAVQDAINSSFTIIDLAFMNYRITGPINLKSDLIIRNGSITVDYGDEAIIADTLSNITLNNVTIDFINYSIIPNEQLIKFPARFENCSTVKLFNSTFVCASGGRNIGIKLSNDIIVQDCLFTDAIGTTLTIIACDNVDIGNSEFKGDGVNVYAHLFDVYGKFGDTNKVDVHDCLFHESQGGIQFTATPGQYDITNSSISNCTFVNFGANFFKVDGVTSCIPIRNCLFDTTKAFGTGSGYGITFNGQSGLAYKILIEDCIIKNCASYAIDLFANTVTPSITADSFILRNNIFYDCDRVMNCETNTNYKFVDISYNKFNNVNCYFNVNNTAVSGSIVKFNDNYIDCGSKQMNFIFIYSDNFECNNNIFNANTTLNASMTGSTYYAPFLLRTGATRVNSNDNYIIQNGAIFSDIITLFNDVTTATVNNNKDDTGAIFNIDPHTHTISSLLTYADAETIGLLTNLLTTDKSNVVAAINELVNNIGSLSSLTTTDKSSIVAAINEVAGA